ncbi:MAG: hypothetical protein LBB98_08235 [Treponema sp.]|jgi:H+/gluconate symporter-like permease|nr:hypothetical protein [Treponema sp.]
MTTLGIIGLLLGIAILIFVSYKGFSAVPVTMLAGAVICILNGIGIWTGFSKYWAGGLAGVFSAYFILFFVSSIFANVMEETGACTAIAYKFLDWFGKKHIMTVIVMLCFFMCYGGVSFFVVMFSVGPILESLFKELNIPRKLIVTTTAAGSGAWVLAAPGSTQLSNVIPTALGTSLIAAPGLGFLMLGIGMILEILYCEWVYRKEMTAVLAGTAEGYVSPAGSIATLRAKNDVPGVFSAFLPTVVLLAIIIIGSFAKITDNSTLLACIAMFVGLVLCYVCNIKHIKGGQVETWKKCLSKGSTGAAGSALALGAIVGFGTIVSNTASFTNIVQWLTGLNISVYWKGILSTSVIVGICGSATSGAKLVMQYLGDYFKASGCNLDILHRLIAYASITLDSLPHATGCFLMFAYFGLNHKTCYKYVFWTDTAIPLVLVVIATAICTVIF